MAETILEQLAAICAPSEKMPADSLLQHPWRQGINVLANLLASDGRLFVWVGEAGLLHPEVPDLAGAKESHHELVKDILTWRGRLPVAGTATLEVIRQWCGEHDPGHPEFCSACKGQGMHCCPDCNHEHECGVCEGERTVMSIPEVRHGKIAGVLINRNRLAKVPASLTGECDVMVQYREAWNCVVLAGAQWLVVIVEMSQDRATKSLMGTAEDPPEFVLEPLQ